MRKLENYKPTKFMVDTSHYDETMADYAVSFIEELCHTKGTWAGKKFELIDWQEQIIRDLFGVLKPNGYRQFNTAYIEIPKKQGKSELAAAVALLLLCGDGEERAEVYGCAADRNQAKIVFDVAVDMVKFSPALMKRVKILESQKKIIFKPTNSSYQVLSADVANKHVMYNCTASRPSIESETKEDTIEPGTEKLSLTADPREDGLVKSRTGDTTTDATYNDWYKAVYVPVAKTASATSGGK